MPKPDAFVLPEVNTVEVRLDPVQTFINSMMLISRSEELSGLNPWIYETASKDSFVSIEKAQQVLSFDPQYSNQEAMIRNYRWYLAKKDSFSGGEGVSHRLPWKQKALKLLKIFF